MQVSSSLNLASPNEPILALFPKEGGDRASKSYKRGDGKRKNRRTQKSGNRVLLLGRIRELALYRAEVLRQKGFEVATPDTIDEAMVAIRSSNFDVAVLSYTLPDSMVRDMADEIRAHCPECPIIAVARTIDLDRRIQPDAIAIAEQGPKALIAALRKVLRQN
jgi:DNA-binding response OmpR family regulator